MNPLGSNPYIAGNPLRGESEMFYGREDVFTFITRNLRGRHAHTSLVLYGERRTGKTSVLYQVNRHLGAGYRCVLIDLHALKLEGLSTLLLGMADTISRSLRRDDKLATNVPGYAVFDDDPKSAFEIRFLDDVWRALGEDHLVLMIDEVIRLDELIKAGQLERDVFDYFKHLMQHHPRLSFIFSLGTRLEEMKKDYASLFSVSLYKPISFLEPGDAKELITRPVRDHYRVTPEAVARILQITSRHPYYTQLLCHCIFDTWSHNPKPEIGVADVSDALNDAVEQGSANLQYVWEDSTPEEKALMAGITAATRHATAPVTMRLIRGAWHRAGIALPEPEISTAYNGLRKREVLAVEDAAYSFTVDLQRLWIEKHQRLEWNKNELAEVIKSRAAATTQASSKSRIGHRDWLTTSGAAFATAAVIFAALAVAISFHALPFLGPTQQSTQLKEPAAPPLLADPEAECRTGASPGLWAMPGRVKIVQCTDPRLPDGNIYEYQFDNKTDFQTAWKNFNTWWKFRPNLAAHTCPPGSFAYGLVGGSAPGPPPADRQLSECGWISLNSTPSNPAPAYVWDYPDVEGFVIAEGGPGAPFSELVSWTTPVPGPSSRAP